MFDLKLQGEASTSPHTRIPPWQSETAKANVQTSLQVASGPESGGSLKLGPGHLHLWQMGFKSLQSQVKHLYVDESGDKTTKIVAHVREGSILYSEDSLISRRASLQSGVQQCEHTMLFTNAPLEVGVHLPKMKREEFAGTNMGDCIAFVHLETWDKAWRKSFDMKKKMLANRRVDVGGKSAETLVRKGSDLEPVSYHQVPAALYKCWLREFQVRAVIDWSAASGVLALECLKRDICYTGICYSDCHMKELIDHLSDCVFQEFLDNESPLRDSALAALLSSKTPPKTPKKEKPDTPIGKKTTPEKPAKKPEDPEKPTDSEKSQKAQPKKRAAEAAEKSETPLKKQPKTADSSKKQELLDILAKVKQNAGKDLDMIPDEVSSDGDGEEGEEY